MLGRDLRSQNVDLVRVGDALASVQIGECDQDIVFRIDFQSSVLHRSAALTRVRPSPASAMISVICPAASDTFTFTVRDESGFQSHPAPGRIGRGFWS